MKARVKSIMLEPYFPKVREINGTKHMISREEYRKYLKNQKKKNKK